MKPKVVLLATGGTIASRYDPKLGSTVASQRADELLRMLPRATVEPVHEEPAMGAARLAMRLAWGA